MFERYTEKARRVIFYARYEASQLGSPYIQSEHILLGMLREDKALTNRILRSNGSIEAIRKEIEDQTTLGEKIATSVDLPLSNECKRVLAYAAEEAERLAHRHIGTEHLLLGLLREDKCLAAKILTERGVRLETVREELQKMGAEQLIQEQSTGGSPWEIKPRKIDWYKNFVNEPFLDFSQPEVKRSMQEALAAVKAKLGREYDLVIGGHE